MAGVTILAMPRPALSWPHAAIFAASAACALLPAAPLGVQVALCVPAIAFFGLPHGATDWALARRLFSPDWPHGWPLLFAALYAALIALVAAGAWAVPLPTLIVFVALSIWHFGAEDAGSLGLGRGKMATLACGTLPIAAPALFWPSQTGVILGLMGVPADPGLLRLAGGAAMLVWLAYACCMCLRDASDRRAYLPEAGLLLFVAAAAPPVMSFSLYFCLLHAPRHMRSLPAGLAGWEMLPVSALAVAGIAAAVWFAGGGAAIRPDWAGANAIFWGLACLALPHVTLGRMAAASGKFTRGTLR